MPRWCQQWKQLQGLHLSDKQGSTLNLSAAGAALVGFGIVALAKSSSAVVNIGVPSALALITHQLLLRSFRVKNTQLNLQGRANKNGFKLAIQITPENYFLNQNIQNKEYSPSAVTYTQNPLFKINLTF